MKLKKGTSAMALAQNEVLGDYMKILISAAVS